MNRTANSTVVLQPYRVYTIPSPGLTSKSYLNILLVGQERSFQNILQAKVLVVQLEDVLGDLHNALPVTRFHRLVCHQLQQWAHIIEVIDRLLEREERWPFF